MVLAYVDNSLIFSKEKKTTDDLYKSLEKDFLVIDEENIDKYLDVIFLRQNDRLSILTQPTLVDRISEAITG